MNIEIVEGDLRQVATEDGFSYLPDYEVIAVIGNDTFVAPIFFPASPTAYNEALAYVENAIVDDTWKKYVKETPSYVDGVEFYDEEELYFNPSLECC